MLRAPPIAPVREAASNQVGDNEAGREMQGVTFVCNPHGETIAGGRRASHKF